MYYNWSKFEPIRIDNLINAFEDFFSDFEFTNFDIFYYEVLSKFKLLKKWTSNRSKADKKSFCFFIFVENELRRPTEKYWSFLLSFEENELKICQSPKKKRFMLQQKMNYSRFGCVPRPAIQSILSGLRYNLFLAACDTIYS